MTRHPDLVPHDTRRAWASAGYYSDRDLYTLFSQWRDEHPNRPAVIDPDGAVTYAELDTLARRLACGLQGIGVTAGDVIGIQLANSALACAVELAVAAVGAIALPYPIGRGDHEVASLLARSGARVAIVASDYDDYPCAARTQALATQLPALHTVVAAGDPAPPDCLSLTDLLESTSDTFEPVEHDPDGPARILVSSGSEAEPKMVLYSHNALAGGRGRFMAQLRRHTPELRNLFLLPLGSSFGAHATPTTIAAHGGTLLLQPRFDAAATWEAMRCWRPKHLFGVPTMVRMLLEYPTLSDITSLRAMVVGGAPLDVATAARARELLDCAVINLYGSGDGVNCHTDINGIPSSDGHAGRPDPRAATIRIVDDHLREAPAGETGEIIALGPMTPMCYLGAPDLNHRYRLPGGWVRTGDAGYLDADGNLTIVGRRKDIILRGGLNISPAQVEALLTTHPDIDDVACVPVTDARLGERMCACIATKVELTLDDIIRHLAAAGLDRRKFPELLLLLPRLPLGAAGKVDRQALRALAEQCREARSA
jgi:acyl-CoA synthetase (AMP-forming)/AMP-acid ligase II